MKICIATDFHLSYRQYGLEEREKDFYRQYEKLIEEIIKEKPDLFLQLGDIFDTPYPKPIAIKKYEDGLEKLENEGIRCYGIVGNHTYIQRKNFYPIDCIFEDKMEILNNKSLKVIDKQMDNTVYICGLNHHPRTHNIKPMIDDLYSQGKNCKVKILLLHQSLQEDIGIGYDYNGQELGLNRFDYVFLGHLHMKTTRKDKSTGTVYHYPGSLNSCNSMELASEMHEGRGYSVLDTDTGELIQKTIPSEREYHQYNLMEEQLNDEFIIKARENAKACERKPIIKFNIFGKNLKHIHEMTQQLKDDALTVQYHAETYEDSKRHEPLTDFSTYSIEETIRESFDEEWKGNLAVELFRALSKGDLESAEEIAEQTYKTHYQTENFKY